MRSFTAEGIAPDVAARLAEAGEALAAAGAKVEEVSVPGGFSGSPPTT